MYIQIILCINCVFLLIFGQISSENIEPLDHWDDAQALFQTFITGVVNAENTAKEEQTVLYRKIRTHATDVITKNQEDLQGVAEKYKTQIASLQILGDALGNPQCLEHRENEFIAVFEDFLMDITNCVQRVQFQATEIIHNVKLFMDNAHTIIGLVEERLNTCTRELGDEECIVILIGELQSLIERIPLSIINELVRVMGMNESWMNSIDVCANDKAGFIYAAGNRIIAEIELCLIEPRPRL